MSVEARFLRAVPGFLRPVAAQGREKDLVQAGSLPELAGDFIYVPPYVPHQEINARPDEPCEAVVVRSGQDPIVVNLDLESPEPASAGPSPAPFHPRK